MNEQQTKLKLTIGQYWLLKQMENVKYTRYYRGNQDLIECLQLGYLREVPNSKQHATSLFELTDKGITAINQHL